MNHAVTDPLLLPPILDFAHASYGDSQLHPPRLTQKEPGGLSCYFQRCTEYSCDHSVKARGTTGDDEFNKDTTVSLGRGRILRSCANHSRRVQLYRSYLGLAEAHA